VNIRHTWFTHGYINNIIHKYNNIIIHKYKITANEEASICEVCDAKLTVNHIITEYLKYERNRWNIGIDPNSTLHQKPKTTPRL